MNIGACVIIFCITFCITFCVTHLTHSVLEQIIIWFIDSAVLLLYLFKYHVFYAVHIGPVVNRPRFFDNTSSIYYLKGFVAFPLSRSPPDLAMLSYR